MTEGVTYGQLVSVEVSTDLLLAGDELALRRHLEAAGFNVEMPSWRRYDFATGKTYYEQWRSNGS